MWAYRSKIEFLVLAVLFSTALFGQSQIKVMTYNLMHFPSTLYYDDAVDDYRSRTPVLKAILDDYKPDLLLVCELENAQGADMVLQAFQDDNADYSRANFAYNQSTTNHSLQQLVFYNENKLFLDSQNIIKTAIRDINHYRFKLKANDKTVYLEVFVAHLKSSQGSDNEHKRLKMIDEFMAYMTTLPEDSYVIFGGDLNLYYADEAAYRRLIDRTNAIPLNDPIDQYGKWHNNLNFRTIHTQSPLTVNTQFQRANGSSDGTTGGLDDRFDFLLVSDNLMRQDAKLHYSIGSYQAYGNHGNCFNNNIDDVACSGTIYSQNLRRSLANMSDHLPVVMTLDTSVTLESSTIEATSSFGFKYGNMVEEKLYLKVVDELKDNSLAIYNALGQCVATKQVDKVDIEWDVSQLTKGIYTIVINSHVVGEVLKFVKM